MAIFYVDYEGAAGDGQGSTFSNRASKVSNLGSAPSSGDEVRIKQSPSPTLVDSAAKILRRPMYTKYNPSSGSITKSTTAGDTSVQLWNHGCVTGDWVELHDSTTASDHLDGIWKITRVDDNNFKLNGYTAPGTGDTNAKVIFLGSRVVELSSAVTKTIASTGPRSTTWTASTNVTTALTHTLSGWTTTCDWLVPPGADEINTGSFSGTGKAAYWATGDLNLEDYQQVSFYIQRVSGSSNNGLSLRLCSDTSGDTSEHQVNIPMNETLQTTRWMPVTVNLGSALNNDIKSIALYVDTNNGAQKIRLTNIIACKDPDDADSLTLNSLIGLKTTADPQWWGIGYIEDEKVLIIAGTHGNEQISYYAQVTARFSADNSSANLYKRQPIPHPTTGSDYTSMDNFTHGGSSSSIVTYSGGWNSTDMSSKATDGETFVDCRLGGRGVYISGNHLEVKDIGVVRAYDGFYAGNKTNIGFDNTHAINCHNNSYYLDYSSLKKLNNIYATNCFTKLSYSHTSQYTGFDSDDFNIWALNGSANNAFMIYNSGGQHFKYVNTEGSKMGLYFNNSASCTVDTLDTGMTCGNNNQAFGLKLVTKADDITIGTLNTSNSRDAVVNDGCQNLIINTANCTKYKDWMYGSSFVNFAYFSNSSTSFINGGSVDKRIYIYSGSKAYLYNLALTGTQEVEIASGTIIYSKNHDNVANADKNFFYNATIEPDTTTRNTASGVSWKTSITNASTYTQLSPLAFELGKVVCAANAQVTITLKVYRSSTNIFAGIKTPASKPLGLNTASTSYCSGSSGAWETVTHTFTPTAAGALTVNAVYYATDTSSQVYIDDISITQA